MASSAATSQRIDDAPALPTRISLQAHDSVDTRVKQESSSSDIEVKQESTDDSSFESSPATPASATFPPSPLASPHVKSELEDNNFDLNDGDTRENWHVYIPVGVLKKPISLQPSAFPADEIERLERHDWIRTRVYTHQTHPEWYYVRLYVLPDDVSRKFIPRSSLALRRALRVVMAKVDRSPEAWDGAWRDDEVNTERSCDSAADDDSLWYIFNTLPDPRPEVETMRDPYARKAMEALLTEDEPGMEQPVVGLKTPLYPYQRRSAATMIQREAQPAQMLDPRLQTCRTPDGQDYYYDKEEGSIVREKRLYSEPCGGILAEPMGYGKTLICLAVILATRGHFPHIPTQYQEIGNRVRPVTASLMEMAAAVAGRFSMPWKDHFESLGRDGMVHTRCVKACEKNGGSYTIPVHPVKYGGRRAVASCSRAPAQCIQICSGTLIISPPNLVHHWEHEIARHTEGLRVLVLRNSSDKVPPAKSLFPFDIVLFSRTRFDLEASRKDSPLIRLHWLRVIVDEGHNVGGSGHRTTMVHFLDNLHFERRWCVSGTPSKGLYGVEVSLSQECSDLDLPAATDAVLQGRKKTGSLVDNDLDTISRLRYTVVNFLDMKPWSNPVHSNDFANWTKYMMPVGGDGKRRKSPSVRATLEKLIVRHRSEVVQEETPLPRLENDVTFLAPTFYDKLNLNLFIFIIAINAVTSERTDQDYLFHPKNRKSLGQTIRNLREAGFWWAGSEGNLEETIKIAAEYMEKNREKMSEADIALTTEGIEVARRALGCKALRRCKDLEELGVYINGFPSEAKECWALDPEITTEPLLMGITHARHAQVAVTSRLAEFDPAASLPGDGIRTRLMLERRKHTSESTQKTAPDKPSRNKSPKKTYTKGLFRTLSFDSPLKGARLVATTSAKLSYLLDKVQEFHQTEKIIIFYDNQNSAFWIGEGLELLGIDFRIYANTCSPELRSKYLELFRTSNELRVLLMDLRQASHGLHLANASRVFIVNPIWDPNVESQAIKRAHRIGQTHPVFVETLVLDDTLEHRMLERRKHMSDEEIQHAEKDLLDDNTMSSIIQNEKFLPMPEDEGHVKVAFLRNPAGFFDRHKLPIPDPDERTLGPALGTLPASPTPKRKHAALAFDSSPEPEPTPKRQMNESMTPIRSLFGGGSGSGSGSQTPQTPQTPLNLFD